MRKSVLCHQIKGSQCLSNTNFLMAPSFPPTAYQRKISIVSPDYPDYHVEGAVMGAVALAPGVVEAFQKARDLLEVLEPDDLAFLDFLSFFVGHAHYQSILLRWAQEETWGI